MTAAITLILALILGFFVPSRAQGQGVGIGHFRFPHYMGSAESYEQSFFFPFAARDMLFFTHRSALRLTLDSQMTLPIRGEDLAAAEPEGYGREGSNLVRARSYARRGMGYTPPGLFLGPKISLRANRLSFEIASLAGLALGEGWGHIGFLHRGSVKVALLAQRGKGSSGCICVYVDGYWSNGRYNATYYGVAAAQALPGRPAFAAERPGYLGVSSRLYLIKSWQRWSLMGFISHQNMTDSIMAESPLVLKTEGLSAGAGIAYDLGR